MDVKQLTLKLLSLVMALAMLGGIAAGAEPVVIEEDFDEAFALLGADLDVDLSGIGDFELAQNDIVSEDVATENDVPAAPNGVVNSGSCGPNVTWTLYDDGLVTLSGSGVMDDYFSFLEVPCGFDIVRAVVEEGITLLAMHTFNGCQSLESVSLPDSLQDIYAGAFANCGRLTRVDIPYGVPWVSGYCFYGCYSLDRVTVPESVTEIFDHAFDNCPRLTLYGYDGSFIATYARNNGIPFVSLGAAPARPPKFNKINLSLKVGESQTLTVNNLSGRSVTWSSSNKKVATVSRGKVKAVGAGECIISANVEDSKTLKCNVTVTDPAKLSKVALSLKVGESQTLTVNNLSGRSVTWSSSNKKVATVSRGKVKAVGAGKCVISAKIKDGKTLKCNVTVTDPAKLSKTKLTISAVDSTTVKLTGVSGKKVT